MAPPDTFESALADVAAPDATPAPDASATPAPDATPSATPAATPAVQEPAATPSATPSGDRTANARKAVEGFREHIPETERAAYDARMEQFGRYADDHEKLVAANESAEAYVDEVRARGAAYDQGELDEAIKSYGPKVAMQMIKDAEAREAKPEATPDDADVPEWAKGLVSDMTSLKAENARVSQERDSARHEARYNAEVGPVIEATLKDFGIGETDMDSARNVLAQLTSSIYTQEVKRAGGDESRVNCTDVANHAIGLAKVLRGGDGSAAPAQAASVTPSVTVDGKPSEPQYDTFQSGLDDLSKSLRETAADKMKRD